MTSQHMAERLHLVSRLWEAGKVAERGTARYYRIDMVAGRVLASCGDIATAAMLNAYAIGRMPQA